MTDIWTIVKPYLAAENLELDDLELSGHGRGRVLRVTVDGEGVDIDRLAEISNGLSRVLDDAPELQQEYRLEVSSPGLERKLRRPAHYRKSIGREVKVKAEFDGARATHNGVLVDASDTEATIETGTGTINVPYGHIVSARTVFRWDKAPKPGHQGDR
jgi:ribosome maturation factor RimP